MPTGYTNIIDDNPDVSFEAFAWRCARAFGALITMRDDPTGAPIPEELQPEPYYYESVAKNRSALAEAEALTIEQAESLMAKEEAERERRNVEYQKEHGAKRAGYDRMVKAAQSWKPPSPDHDGLKRFMLEQLSTGDPGACYQVPRSTTTVSAWLSERRARAAKSLAYSLEELAKEEKRTRSRNAWLRALRESIGNPPTESK